MTGPIFDGHDLSELFVCGEPELSILNSQPRLEDAANRDGSMVLGRTWGDSSVTFSLGILGDAIERRDKLSTLGAWLAVDGARELVLPDSPDRRYMAVPEGAVESRRAVDGESAQVTFKLVDPIARGARRSVTVPSGGSASFTVGGTAPTRPRITAAAAVRNASSQVWGLRLDEGDFVHVATGSASARAVEVDCDNRTVLLAGAAHIMTLDSDWLVLAPFDAGGGTAVHVLRMDAGTGAATVEWDERWY